MSVVKRPTFESEAALCAAFIAAVGDYGDRRKVASSSASSWTAYAETAGWDILLVRDSDGFQIGIEAKLSLNVEVLNQAIEDGHLWNVTSPGPDCRSVLVPEGATSRLGKIADALGITVIRMRLLSAAEQKWNSGFTPYLPDEKLGRNDGWYERMPSKRHQLPEYIPDVPAGSSAPVQLTQWKIGALKLAATLNIRGFLTREDFKHHRVDHRRFIDGGWLQKGSDGWVRGPAWPNFEAQHPRVYAEITADADKWMPEKVKLL